MTRTLALAIVIGLLVGAALAEVVFTVAGPDGTRRLLQSFGAECVPDQAQAQPSHSHVDGRWRVAKALLRGHELTSSVVHAGSVARDPGDPARCNPHQVAR